MMKTERTKIRICRLQRILSELQTSKAEGNELAKSRSQTLEGILRGEYAILENRTLSQAAAKKKMKKWLEQE